MNLLSTTNILLLVSILLILIGIGLTMAGTLSAAWQVVELTEFGVEHEHGLWIDCARSIRPNIDSPQPAVDYSLHCMYKFDDSAEQVVDRMLWHSDYEGAGGESVQHKFWVWQKIVLSFIVASEFLAILSLCMGCLSNFLRGTSLAFIAAVFLMMLSSIIADSVFFIAANRIDVRFVQALVGTYEQRIGYAFYLHGFGTLSWFLAFISSIFVTLFSCTNPKKLENKEDMKIIAVREKPVPITRSRTGHPSNTISPISDNTYIRMESPNSEKSYGILKKTRLHTPSTTV